MNLHLFSVFPTRVVRARRGAVSLSVRIPPSLGRNWVLDELVYVIEDVCEYDIASIKS
jgi:hypothetical protein